MDRELSKAARVLYAAANFHSAEAGHAGYISDALLEDLEDADPSAIDELISSDQWERTDLGYKVIDLAVVEELKREFATRQRVEADLEAEMQTRQANG